MNEILHASPLAVALAIALGLTGILSLVLRSVFLQKKRRERESESDTRRPFLADVMNARDRLTLLEADLRTQREHNAERKREEDRLRERLNEIERVLREAEERDRDR